MMCHFPSLQSVSIPEIDPIRITLSKLSFDFLTLFIFLLISYVSTSQFCRALAFRNRLKGQLYDGSTRLYDAETGTEPIAMYSFAGLAEYAVVPETAAFLLPPLLAKSFGYGVFQVWMVYPLVIQKAMENHHL